MNEEEHKRLCPQSSPYLGPDCECGLERDGKVNKIAILIEALNKIEGGDFHDDMCVSDSGTRMDDCMDDHRCYCASRLALKALCEAKAREI